MVRRAGVRVRPAGAAARHRHPLLRGLPLLAEPVPGPPRRARPVAGAGVSSSGFKPAGPAHPVPLALLGPAAAGGVLGRHGDCRHARRWACRSSGRRGFRCSRSWPCGCCTCRSSTWGRRSTASAGRCCCWRPGSLVAFLGSDQTPPPRTILILLAWLVFRLEFGAGHDQDPRRPGVAGPDGPVLPPRDPADAGAAEPAGPPAPQGAGTGWRSWATTSPSWWCRSSCSPRSRLASVAAGIIVFTQLWLVASGNFAWLNWMAIVLAFAAVSDPVAHAVLPAIPLDWHAAVAEPGAAPASGSRRRCRGSWWSWSPPCCWWCSATGRIENLVLPPQLMNASFNRWQLVNTYGAFGTVTKRRIEIVVEGTLDAEPGDDADWREYGFKGKPGDVRADPAPVRPVPPAAGLADVVPAAAYRARGVVLRVPGQAAGGGPAHAAAAAPRPVRRRTARTGCVPRSYLYRFSTRAEFRATGQRWIRTPLYVVIPPSRPCRR